ncbi:MAG: Gldg family protein [Treponema sp.]|nr:Gldg family protein [Treponema sp.]
MKNFIKYIKSSRSDIVLFAIFLLLLNLVAYRAFVRFDLTAPRSYSLSKASIQTVRTLEEPLSVKVFFTSNLPAPYNSVDQYVRDLMTEYKGKANRNFSCEFFDMSKPENETIARTYKLNQIQIREVKNNEVGFKQVWMGMVFTYADTVETLDGITSPEGLEYKITAKINNMISTTSTLAGLNGKVKLTLYKTDAMKDLGIQGFKEMEGAVKKAYTLVNAKNQDKIELEVLDPNFEEAPPLVQKYGLQAISWDKGEKHGVLGLVLEYDNTFRLLPVRLERTFFGQNVISGLDTLEDTLTESLKSLVSKTVEIGYITGHGEWNINDDDNGSGKFNDLVKDRYSFKLLNLQTDEITPNLTSVVINGPKRAFTDAELYKIDQYLLKGGNLLLFLDPVDEVLPQGEMAYYQQPSYNPIDTGLAKILDKYGIKMGKNYVLDERCYVQTNQMYGKMPVYFVPELQKQNLNQKHVISKNLGYVYFMQASTIDVDDAKAKDSEKVTVLAKSSPNSWLMSGSFHTNPSVLRVPTDKSTLKSENLAVLVEGKFQSAFDAKPEDKQEDNTLSVSDHLKESVQSGKIFAVGSSKLTRPQLIANEEQPVAMFVRNAVDYLNGEEDLCAMRTKGLALNTLNVKSMGLANAAKYFNIYGLVVIVAIIGLIMWQRRNIRRRIIRMTYNPNDSREISGGKSDNEKEAR